MREKQLLEKVLLEEKDIGGHPGRMATVGDPAMSVCRGASSLFS
jgi:hypothetical protein